MNNFDHQILTRIDDCIKTFDMNIEQLVFKSISHSNVDRQYE